MITIADLRQALQSSNLQAFLRMIRAGETSASNDEAYCALFGWKPGNGVAFSDLTHHPRKAIKSPWGWTSAAGAYQAMAKVEGVVTTDTWDGFVQWCAGQGHQPMFGRLDQDLFAVWCIAVRRKALDDVLAGRVDHAIARCCQEWASLPGSPYGQPTRTLAQALSVYAAYGGKLSAETAAATAPAPEKPPAPVAPQTYPTAPTEWDLQQHTPQEKPMAPFIIPAVIELAKLIPQLGGLFGGSEVAQRNVKAAEVVVNAVTAAVGASNAQDAVAKVAADPTARATAEKAVQSIWYELTEVGGGIDGARKAEQASNPGGGMLQSPVFWVTILLLPLVYIALYAVLFREGFGTEIRAMVLGAIFGGLLTGGIQSYFYGTSASSARKTEISARTQ